MSDDEKQSPIAATLAGRSSSSQGAAVHVVMGTERERRFGIRYAARSLCGKTHGARSAGWATAFGAVTCARCIRLTPAA